VDSECRECGCLTFVVIVLAVETTLQFVRTTILCLDLVVKRSNVGRNLSSCNGGRGSEEYAEGGGREMHGLVSRYDKCVGSKVGWTQSSREVFVSGEKDFQLRSWSSMFNMTD
jgi:hypothetical protein